MGLVLCNCLIPFLSIFGSTTVCNLNTIPYILAFIQTCPTHTINQNQIINNFTYISFKQCFLKDVLAFNNVHFEIQVYSLEKASVVKIKIISLHFFVFVQVFILNSEVHPTAHIYFSNDFRIVTLEELCHAFRRIIFIIIFSLDVQRNWLK